MLVTNITKYVILWQLHLIGRIIMVHEMKLKPQYFDLIKCGKKIYEIRLNDEKRQQMKIGDSLIFKREPEMIELLNTKIENLIYFETFEEMIQTLSPEQIGFKDSIKSEILDLYYRFYTKEEEKKYGVVAIKVRI